MKGIMSINFMSGLSSSGNTLFLMIFSMIRGTVMISLGCTVAKASIITFGEGTRVRKKMWQPLVKQ